MLHPADYVSTKVKWKLLIGMSLHMMCTITCQRSLKVVIRSAQPQPAVPLTGLKRVVRISRSILMACQIAST